MTTIKTSDAPAVRRMIQSVTPLMTHHLCGCLEVNDVKWLCSFHSAKVIITTQDGKTAVHVPADLFPQQDEV